MAQQTSETRGGGARGWQALDVYRGLPAAANTLPIPLDYGYPLYRLHILNYVPATDDGYLFLQKNVAGTAQVATTDYTWMGTWIDSVGAEAVSKVNGGIDSTGIPIIGTDEGAANENPGSGAGDSGSGVVYISGLNSAFETFFKVDSAWTNGAETFIANITGYTLVPEECDGVTLLIEADNFETNMTIYVEGYNA